MVDFHDGRQRTDADVIDIDEVYEDAVQWVFSTCGAMTFDHACHAVGMDPVRLRSRLRLLRSRISFHQFIRYQPCAICQAPSSEPDRWRAFFWPLCPRCSAQRRAVGIGPFSETHRVNPVRVSMTLFKVFHETYRNRI